MFLSTGALVGVGQLTPRSKLDRLFEIIHKQVPSCKQNFPPTIYATIFTEFSRSTTSKILATLGE